MLISNLEISNTASLNETENAFASNNPGYSMAYHRQVISIEPVSEHRLAFLQKGGGSGAIGADSSKISVGDIIYIKSDRALELDSLMDFLVFTIPGSLPEDIPIFIRPDWDMNITDVPGGCATETNAYRRILLTWLGKNGSYLYHGLNAHRVRILDSFTHHHPVNGGFDEFYLVQMALPGAKLITSERVDLIESPSSLSVDDLSGLVNETKLNVGDLVYLPRGVAHRGVGGVLAQIITVPGFIPGSEIGIDHQLKSINERLSLSENALPYNIEAADQVVIK